jgi:signal transduction histidine kinase
MRTQRFDRADQFLEIAWRFARAVWLLLALVMVCLLVLFTYYYVNRLIFYPCPVLDFCRPRNSWISPTQTFRWAFVTLQLASLIVPAVIWMTLAVWVFVSKPRWLWGFVFSLSFLFLWYSEANLQPVRVLLKDAVAFTLIAIGFPDLAYSLEVQARVDLFRGVIKMLADVLLVATVFTFPNGQFWPRWSKGFLGLFVVIAFCYSIPPLRYTSLNYLYWPYQLGTVFFLVLTTGLMVAIVQRFVFSDAQTKNQLHGIWPSMLACVFWYVLATMYEQYLEFMLFPAGTRGHLEALHTYLTLFKKVVNALLLVWFATAIAQSIARHQLFDIRFVLNRTLAYAALTVSTISIYALVVGGLGSLFRQSELWLSILATAVVAALFQPLLTVFRRAANRLIYGERDDPYRVISNLGRRLEAALPSEDVLQTIVRTVADSLKLPFVSLRLSDGRVVSAGASVAEPVEFALQINGQMVGWLEVSSRHANEVFTPSECRLLSDLANRAALAVNEVQLAAALRQSREALVVAREEERKRIRRDLHDGLGPTLVGVSMTLDASRDLLDADRARAEALLASSSARVQEAIADIRRLVDDLRPPALDTLGLTGAIRAAAQGFVSLLPSVDSDVLPSLPAAVEVAAYRIASEAMNNAIRHARASHIWVGLRIIGDELYLEIADDGIGLPERRRDGAGLQTMRERALELGGRFELQSLAQGTSVRAWLAVNR